MSDLEAKNELISMQHETLLEWERRCAEKDERIRELEGENARGKRAREALEGGGE